MISHTRLRSTIDSNLLPSTKKKYFSILILKYKAESFCYNFFFFLFLILFLFWICCFLSYEDILSINLWRVIFCSCLYVTKFCCYVIYIALCACIYRFLTSNLFGVVWWFLLCVFYVLVWDYGPLFSMWD